MPTNGHPASSHFPLESQDLTLGRGHEQLCSDLVVAAAIPYCVTEEIKENRMKSKNLFAVVLASLIVLALSLPVMAQSTTQSTTNTTTQNPSGAPSQSTTTRTSQDQATMPAATTQTTDTTVTPADPEVKHSDTTTTTVTPQ